MTLFLDPATAPNIPVKVDLSMDREVAEVENWETLVIENKLTGRFSVKIVIRAWDRKSDKVSEWTIEADNRDKLEMVMREVPPNEDDLTWLRNIGARR